jgi:sulfate adenylyltransferase
MSGAAVLPESSLIPPYGGRLVDLRAPEAEREGLAARLARLPSLQLTPRSLCDLENLATGGFSPLDRFLGEADYRRVIQEMRLADGTLFPIPVTLPLPDDAGIRVGEDIVLRTPQNDPLALMTVAELYRWSREEEARLVYRTEDPRHPMVAEMASWGGRLASGPLTVLALPRHLRLHPAAAHSRAGEAAPRRPRVRQRRGVPDAQPDPPRARGADQARRGAGRGKSSHPPRRGA